MAGAMIKRILRAFNLEMIRIRPGDFEPAEKLGIDSSKLGIRELSMVRAIEANGHIALDEAQFLSSLIHRTSPQDPIVEIGTLFGYSTLVMCMAKPAGQKIITVDNFAWNPLSISPQAHEALTRALLSDGCKNHSAEIVKKDKDLFYKDYQGPAPGLFFCDADHSYEATLRDLTWARSVGTKIICGHDYDAEKHPGVVRAVKEVGGAKEIVGTLFLL